MTASARIHAALRDRIVALELAPGSALPEKEFAESFGVSRTPVREALLRLAEEQLVDIYPQSGTFVAPIRVSVVQDAMVIRNALERFAAGAAAARARAADIAALDRTSPASARAAALEDIDAFHASDEAMHQLIANIAGHPNIWRVVKREKANVDRVRLLSLHFAGRFETVIAEHARIVEAVSATSTGRGGSCHARASRPRPSQPRRRVAEKYPDYFEDEAAPKARPRRAARASS